MISKPSFVVHPYLGWDCFTFRKAFLLARFENHKKKHSACSKKEASFIFEARSYFHFFVVHPYLGWESNPHGIATTGF